MTIVNKYIEAIFNELNTNKDLLNQLDAAIGDGDHGSNVVRGFQAIVDAKAEINDSTTLSQDMMKCASLLMSKIGGSSGPLLSTIFLQLSTTWKDKQQITGADLASGLSNGLKAVQDLGKASAGEKTMVDALIPAVAALKSDSISFDAASAGADAGCEKTKDMKATKGRASYLGERSIGHIDPGAKTISLVFKALKGVK